MLLVILLAILVLAIIYLLFVPIILYIDTDNAQYFIELKGLAKVNLVSDKLEIIKGHLKVMFFNFDFYPLRKGPYPNKGEIRKKTTKKKHLSTMPIKSMVGVIRSFKIKQFRVELDSGDCIFNSKLYPVFALLNFYKDTHLSVNFEGRNSVLLSLENRPIRIIKSFINN